VQRVLMCLSRVLGDCPPSYATEIRCTNSKSAQVVHEVHKKSSVVCNSFTTFCQFTSSQLVAHRPTTFCPTNTQQIKV